MSTGNTRSNRRLTGAAAISHATKRESGRGYTFSMPVPGPGGPPLYTPEEKAALCDRLADGETLRAICKEPGMPSRRVVYQWVAKDDAFAAMFAQAQQEQAAALIDKAIAAAEDARDKDSAQAARVKSETFLKVAGLLDPARWQPKQPVGGAVSVTIRTTLDLPGQQSANGGYVIEAPSDDRESAPQKFEQGHDGGSSR